VGWFLNQMSGYVGGVFPNRRSASTVLLSVPLKDVGLKRLVECVSVLLVRFSHTFLCYHSPSLCLTAVLLHFFVVVVF
jgi:hypothetical protein